MKQVALYIILFSYTLVILKPVTPYISDAVAHVFFYAQHMATVHYQNGKFHVHREIIDNAKKTASDKESESPSSKKQNSANDHIVLAQRHQVINLSSVKAYHILASSSLMYTNISGDYPPPRI